MDGENGGFNFQHSQTAGVGDPGYSDAAKKITGVGDPGYKDSNVRAGRQPGAG